MKHKKLFLFAALAACMILFFSVPALAAELTEADVEQAVASQGKETVTGNVFIWFLCAIAFLKVSQKIDSFMASGGYQKAASPGATAVGGSFLSGGLAGAVGRQVERSAVNAATGYTEYSSIGNSIYRSSLSKGGDFANNVISSIACGNYGQVGSIKGPDAEKAYISYMNLNSVSNKVEDSVESHVENTSMPSFTNMEIGGGRITGTENTDSSRREFALYHADQYMAPQTGTYETVQAVDGSTWYKQYAQDAVSKTPYDAGDGKVAYHETIVQQLPPVPQRKDRI